MNKTEFTLALCEKLSFLPWEETQERATFYTEMIDDRMEEGLSEEEAVAAVGSVEEIAEQIIGEIPLAKIVKEKMKSKRRLKGWEIALLVLGSPVWLSLLIAAAAVVFSLYVSLWSVIISLWAVFAALAGCSLGGVAAGVVFACTGNVFPGIAVAGAGILCAGLAVFMFLGCKAATKGILILTKKIAVWIKNGFVKKEGVQ